jgi:autotransporter-associated beta strand protein
VTNFVNYRALLSGAATGDVVNITTFSNLAADTTIYALRLGNNTRLTNNSGANDRTLTLLSGGLLVAGAATNDAHLLFRDASSNAIEGLIYNSSTLRLSGTNHAAYITKFGDGTLIAGSQQTGYTNGWNINRGTLEANLATGVVGTGGTNYAFGAAVPENVINLNGNTTLRLTTVATNQVYASGKITSWDNNIISASFGNQDDRRIYFAPLGMDLNSISNGPLGTQLRVDLERTRSELHSLGLVTLNADTIFNIRDTGTASGNTGSTNRLILDGGLNSTNRIIVKYGNGVLELPGDNNTTMVNNQIRVTGGALSVGHNGALGDVNSSITIITNSVLELNAALTDFTPIATVNQQAGSAERWLGQYNRFANDNTLETYFVPTNVTLQISATHNNAAGSNNLYKTIRLQGGGLEGYQFNGDNRSTTLTISNQIEFTSDLQIGRSGIDAGRATVVSVFNGSFTEINPGLDFIKVGGDVVQLGAGAKNYTGDTIVRSGELRNGVANAVRTTSLLNVEANGIFNLNNFAQTIAGLSGSGMVTNSGTGAAEGLTLNFAGTQVFSGAIGGIMALTNNGPGTQVLSGRNTFTGATAVSGGTLELAEDGSLGGTAQIQIATGGTLLLSGSPANRINDLAGMNLAGGTFNSGGLAEALGALTLSASSTIDLGSGASTLSFSSGTRTAGSLTIDNWSGSLAGGGTDQLRFDSALDSTFLANINFTGFDPGALQISFGSYVEIVPVPEPATVLASLALASLGLWRERRRLRHWLKR